MANIATLMVKIGSDISELEKGLSKASRSVQDAGKRMTSLGKTISTRVTAPLTALGAVAVRAFGVQEQAERKLRAALQANGRQVDHLFNRYNKFAQEMQRLTVVGDETTLSMLSQAESLGLTADSAERAVRNSIAMQSAFGVNAESALRYTAALEQGNATMLTRYIPTLRNIEDESERVAAAQDVLAKAFQSAEAEAQSSSGQFIQMRNAVGDLLEVIGEAISEAIIPFVNRLKELAEVAQTVDKAKIRLAVTIGAVAGALGPLLIAMGTFLKLLAAVMTPIFLKIAAISALVVAFEFVRRNLDVFIEHIARGFAIMRNTVVEEVDRILQVVQNWARFLPGQMDIAVASTRAALATITDDVPEITGEFQSAGEFIQDVIGDIGRAFEWLSNMVFGEDVDDGFTDGIERATIATKELEMQTLRYVEAGKTLKELLGDIKTNSVEMGQALQTTVSDAITSFAETLGNAFTGDAGASGFFNNILIIVSDFGKQLGRMLIAAGIAAQAFQKLLVNPVAAIVAGSALVAASTAVRNLLASGPVQSVNDALITSSGKVIEFHPNDNILAMKDFSGLTGGGSVKIQPFVLPSGDIVFSQERGLFTQSRTARR